MKLYETTFILSPQADDAAFDRQINAISNLITSKKGKLVHEDRWGIRRLAYPIRKFTQGFYTRLIYEGNSEILHDMERHFRLEEPYIRHLTVLFEGDLALIKGDREEKPRETRQGKPKEVKKEEAPVKAEAPAEEKPAEETSEKSESESGEEKSE